MMKRSKAILLSLLFLVMLIPASHAQDLSTQGKEFWLSFISNGFKYHPNIPPSGWVRVQLMVSAKRSCEGTILNPNTGWRHNFTVEANNIFSIDLEEEQVYIENYEYEQVVNKGLMITTTDTVSVYCANIATYSFDASYVLPTQGLGADYIIQTHEQSTGSYDPTSAFVIVATEDNTTVDITPKVKTLGNKPAGQQESVGRQRFLSTRWQLRQAEEYQAHRRYRRRNEDGTGHWRCLRIGRRRDLVDRREDRQYRSGSLWRIPSAVDRCEHQLHRGGYRCW